MQYSFQAFQSGIGAVGATLPADFTTSFPATENPISESSIWTNGLTDGLDWNNVQTTNATDGVHRACGSAFITGFDDPSAILKTSYRTFANNQFAQGVIYRAAGYTPSANYHETQLRLRFNLSAHSATGYELLIALDNSGSANDGWAVVKWNGAANDFTTISNHPASITRPADGDVWRFSITGTTAKVLLGGVQQGSDIDLTHDVSANPVAVWPSGNPGIGMYPQTPGCTLASYGWRSFTAGDL